MTHGEKWLTATVTRIAAYCKARGWRCSEPYKIAPRQHEVEIRDAFDNRATLALLTGEGRPYYGFRRSKSDVPLLDDAGFDYDVTAEHFDRLLAPFGLQRPPLRSKRQLTLPI